MRPSARLAALVTATALAAGGLGLAAGAATAASDPTAALYAHDPVGALTSTRTVSGGVQLSGWASDPDATATSNITIYGVVDGTRFAASGATTLANASIRSAHHTGPTPGFSFRTPVPAGRHTVCAVARTVGAGSSTVLGCATTPLGTSLSASQKAAHLPTGALVKTWASSGATSSNVRFRGWTSDPDWTGRRMTVVLYLDGSPAKTLQSTSYSAVVGGSRPAAAGVNSAFEFNVPVSSGTHIGCVWSVNVGIGNGSNKLLGCRAVDTRGPAGTGSLPSPSVNKTVLAEALKHRNQNYVWGATGPKVFDCSGLVLYSYAKAGRSLPRVSQDQARAARLIPASRAVPGDLVFTHDTVGDVYHVGIYVRPGMAFAAIDTAEGVDYQNIWDPSATTYGSFTHT